MENHLAKSDIAIHLCNVNTSRRSVSRSIDTTEFINTHLIVITPLLKLPRRALMTAILHPHRDYFWQ